MPAGVQDDLPSSAKHLTLQSYQPREDSFGRFISPFSQQYPFMGERASLLPRFKACAAQA